jgi:uncharacterized protein YbjT (DUF2867 family)
LFSCWFYGILRLSPIYLFLIAQFQFSSDMRVRKRRGSGRIRTLAFNSVIYGACSVEDIGKITAAISGDVDRYAGGVIDIAGDQLTGLQLAEILTQATGRQIVYQRFPTTLLEENKFLRRNAELFDEGRAAGNADIAALKQEFGDLLSVAQWLSGPGSEPLKVALFGNGDRPLALK